MSAAVERFIRHILQRHAMEGVKAIDELSSRSQTDLNAVTVVLPNFGEGNEHSLYEFACATTIDGMIRCSIRGRYDGNRDVDSLQKYHHHLQRFIDALKNEQSVVECAIEKQKPLV
jgi:hypothetical protein